MVSYYNHPFAMYQKNHSGGGNLPYSASPSAWYSASNYHHQPPNAAQFLDTDAPPQHMYHYPPHMLPPQPSPDWVGHDNYTSPSQNGSLLQNPGGPGAAAFLSLNQAAQNGSNSGTSTDHITDGIPNLPSPPATIHSGSDMSSPGATHGPSSSPQIPSRPTPVKSPYEWMKKPSYQSQPNPGSIINICSAPSLDDFSMEINGKTRTKDKYRVVYTDHQRLELEKEFHYTRYITIRRKAEIAQTIGLTERQVKIWFQNRRAADRKRQKKIDSGVKVSTSMSSSSSSLNFLDVKPKIDPALHFQHLQMNALGIRLR